MVSEGNLAKIKENIGKCLLRKVKALVWQYGSPGLNFFRGEEGDRHFSIKMFLIYFAVSLQFFYAFCRGEVAEDIYEFTAKDVKGNHVNLSDFRGKVSLPHRSQGQNILGLTLGLEHGSTDNKVQTYPTFSWLR